MALRRYKIILNPIAGKGRAGERIGEIQRLLKQHEIEYRMFLTERVGHATQLAVEASNEGYDVVVAAGGDGTANEVINGLMSLSGKKVPYFGVLAVGRGNDFAYGAGIHGNLEAAVRVLSNREPRPLDVGHIVGGDYPQGRYFGNGIGVGFDTIVGLEAAKLRHVHGFMAYVIGALKTLIMYPDAPEVRVELDGETIEQASHQISIMNGNRMGGTFFMAPRAKNDDGLLDLCMAPSMTRREMIGMMGRYIKGTQAESPLIKTARSTNYKILAPKGGLVIHADGETICVNGNSVEIQCVAGALRIFSEGRKVEA